EADLSKEIIRAPFSGIVGTIDAEVGEVVGAGDTIIRLISEEDNFSIEANISEVNIAKINVGNKVRAVFDALPDQSFYGSVSHIDSTETIIDDVVNYKVTILVDSSAINDKTDKIKSGMTANLFVETAERQNVLIVPLFALTRSTEGGETKFVAQKLVGGSRSEETSVVLGVVGSDGRAEVLSGLSEGDVLVIEK
ncbi:MAG: HlyD family efflux transporter periplasmic adaptor subunit, partial [Patescibacteria group bacterium]